METVGFEVHNNAKMTAYSFLQEDIITISVQATWNGVNNPHPPAHATGLKVCTIVLPRQRSVRGSKRKINRKQHEINETINGFTVVDPSGITVQFEIETA